MTWKSLAPVCRTPSQLRNLQRDLKEAALSVAIKSSKTTLILCGSIVEAILLDRISSNKIRRYKLEDGKTKQVERMDLGDLLFVAYREKLIDEQLYHLAHVLRGFRNLIHPGVEVRKTAMKVNESNAKIAWDVTRKFILEMS